jgi:hypothetical protein
MYHIPQEMCVLERERMGDAVGEKEEDTFFLCSKCYTNSPKNQYDISRRRYDEGHAMLVWIRTRLFCKEL